MGRGLLGGAGLAADLQARDARRFAGAVLLVDHVAHHAFHGTADVGVEDAVRRALGRGVVGVGHEPKRLVHAVVGQDEEGLGELDRGHGHALAEGLRGHVQGGPGLERTQQPLALAGDGQARGMAEAELFEIGMQARRAELEADLGRADVARNAHDHADGQHAVGVRVLDDATGEGELAVFAIERRGRLDHALLERRGHEQGLHGGAGLEHVQRGVVAGDARADAAPHVGVEEGVVGHGQDLARGHVDHDGRAGLGVVGGDGLFQLLLGEELDLGIDGQAHALAVDVVEFASLGIEKEAAARGVALHHVFGLAAGKALVEGLFHAFQAHVAHADEAHELAGEVAVGIKTCEFLGEIDAGQFRFADAGGGAVAHAPGKIDHGGRALQLLEHPLFLHAQHFRQEGGGLFRFLDFLGPHEQGLDLDAFGEEPAAPVVDLAPGPLVHFRGQMLPDGFFRQFRAGHDLEIARTGPQPEPGQTEKNAHAREFDPAPIPDGLLLAIDLRSAHACSRVPYGVPTALARDFSLGFVFAAGGASGDALAWPFGRESSETATSGDASTAPSGPTRRICPGRAGPRP